SMPLATGVHEVVVANKLQPPLTTVNDLAGKSVFINPSTSYMQSVNAFNEQLKKQGLAPLRVNSAPGNFEPEDILEMINANLAGYTVVDRYLALLWQKIYPNLVVYDHIALREDGNIALAWRKNSPLLRAKLDPFCASHKLGSSFGNQQIYKYLRSVKWVKSATSEKELTKFAQVTAIFQKYGKQYSVDWLLMVAQGYQESQLDQTKRSHSGAIGIMQILPSTGKSLKVGDITQADPNINAGVKYIRFMQERYFADQPMDDLNKMLFTFAAYNAGPAKVESLRKQAKTMGLDPNRWFDNVERVAQLKIGNETVQYVSNIFKYYVAYTLIKQEQLEKEQAAKPAPPLI
ncbi:MAG: transglycosylase SLT domain-containing protein, partial [Hafnia sp.]